ncbi:uncharacterized protein LOC109417550 [Aedes albopictus]|uniref:DUF4806 domain-containing protein n=1 Tax=Aedes albopictus TaxID=7160 RepID=A0ABM1ZVW9_AEDAL
MPPAIPSRAMPPPSAVPCKTQLKPIINQPQLPQPTPVVTNPRTIVGARIIQQQKHAYCGSNVNDSVPVIGEHCSLMSLPQPHFSGAEANAMVIGDVHEPQQPEPIYCTMEDICFLPEPVTVPVNLDNHLITDNTGSIKYEELKNDLKHYIRTTMEEVVQKCFHEHFSRLTALSQMNTKTTTTPVSNSEDDPVENHNRIENEVQLHDWNVKLANEELCAKYLVYFTRIIPPNSYATNGDNACYTIVDCLFTRDFWTRFTWTGISRGQKSKRGFREFGNVLKLLEDLVRIGDPTYSAKKLEDFCRTRLFRYSRSRSSNKQLRKSACRPARKRKADKVADDQMLCEVKNEEPIELVDDAQIDSDEEFEQDDQDEPIDEADEADEEPDDDDENSASGELSD